MILFTSDTHFGHGGKPTDDGQIGGIIRYSKRPYTSIEEHDADLIRRWNERVSDTDTVYHLGDFALGDQRKVPDILAQLNGTVHLIWGNHDDQKRLKHMIGPEKGQFASAQDVAWIKVDGERIFLSHYAHRVWNRSHRGSFHLYGHTHNGIPAWGRSLDAGVDAWNYTPTTFDEIKARLTALGEIDKFQNHHPDGE